MVACLVVCTNYCVQGHRIKPPVLPAATEGDSQEVEQWCRSLSLCLYIKKGKLKASRMHRLIIKAPNTNANQGSNKKFFY